MASPDSDSFWLRRPNWWPEPAGKRIVSGLVAMLPIGIALTMAGTNKWDRLLLLAYAAFAIVVVTFALSRPKPLIYRGWSLLVLLLVLPNLVWLLRPDPQAPLSLAASSIQPSGQSSSASPAATSAPAIQVTIDVIPYVVESDPLAAEMYLLPLSTDLKAAIGKEPCTADLLAWVQQHGKSSMAGTSRLRVRSSSATPIGITQVLAVDITPNAPQRYITFVPCVGGGAGGFAGLSVDPGVTDKVDFMTKEGDRLPNGWTLAPEEFVEFEISSPPGFGFNLSMMFSKGEQRIDRRITGASGLLNTKQTVTGPSVTIDESGRLVCLRDQMPVALSDINKCIQ